MKKIVWVIFILSFAGIFISFIDVLMYYFPLRDIQFSAYKISFICIALIIMAIIYNAFIPKKFITNKFVWVFIASIVIQFMLFYLFVVLTSE